MGTERAPAEIEGCSNWKLINTKEIRGLDQNVLQPKIGIGFPCEEGITFYTGKTTSQLHKFHFQSVHHTSFKHSHSQLSLIPLTARHCITQNIVFSLTFSVFK